MQTFEQCFQGWEASVAVGLKAVQDIKKADQPVKVKSKGTVSQGIMLLTSSASAWLALLVEGHASASTPGPPSRFLLADFSALSRTV